MNLIPEDDPGLRSLLERARPNVELPVRFQEGVWKRLQPGSSISNLRGVEWIDKFVMWLTQPSQVLVGTLSLIAVGVVLGVAIANHQAHEISKERYFAAVSPATIR